MPMHGAVFVLGRGKVNSLKWRSVFTKARYSARCSSSLCLESCHQSSTLGSLGRTSTLMTLLSSLNSSRNVRRLLTWKKSNGGERTESKCRKDEYHDLWYGPGPLAEFRWVSMCNLSHWSGQQHLLQWLQVLGAKEMQWQVKCLTKDPDYRGTRCQGTACPLDGRPQREISVGPDKLEVVASFCYLGDMLSAAGGRELSITTCVKTAWKKFKELPPVLSSNHLSFKTRSRVYSSCVWSAMLHASETWPLIKPNLQHLQWNDRVMIRQTCNVKPQDIVTTRSNELLARLGIEDLDLILKERRLRWYGHVEYSNGAIKTAFDLQADGKCGPGRPKMIWKQLTERDCREWKFLTLMIDIHGDLVWDLPYVQQAWATWKGAHWCGCCPCTCMLIKNLLMMKIYLVGSQWNCLYKNP